MARLSRESLPLLEKLCCDPAEEGLAGTAKVARLICAKEMATPDERPSTAVTMVALIVDKRKVCPPIPRDGQKVCSDSDTKVVDCRRGTKLQKMSALAGAASTRARHSTNVPWSSHLVHNGENGV